jgi:hypothetical protein
MSSARYPETDINVGGSKPDLTRRLTQRYFFFLYHQVVEAINLCVKLLERCRLSRLPLNHLRQHRFDFV